MSSRAKIQSAYNQERPHESLGQRRPAEVYQPSARRLNENDKPIVYPPGLEVRSVSQSGLLAHEGKNYHLGEAFANKRIGLKHHRNGETDLYFANVLLGGLRFDSEGGRLKPTAYVEPNRKQ